MTEQIHALARRTANERDPFTLDELERQLAWRQRRPGWTGFRPKQLARRIPRFCRCCPALRSRTRLRKRCTRQYLAQRMILRAQTLSVAASRIETRLVLVHVSHISLRRNSHAQPPINAIH